MTGSGIDPCLYEAYRSTRYCAWIGDEQLVLQVGVSNPGLLRLMDMHDASCGCFITAFNPFSQSSDEAMNVAANERLRRTLMDAGWKVFEGQGRAADGSWPAEPSYLVLDCSMEDALGLCTAFGQNAVLWFGPDATPRIVLHPGLGES